MTDDLTLLRAYVDHGAEDAFRTVVERNLGLVYSSALRQVRDPYLAQEVTQAVFLILARKAGSLRPATVLSGWLFRTTRYAASEALRAARRRQRYEQEAAQMLPTTTAPASDATWEEVAPFLDEAMASLGDRDRHAILLRFFERKEMKEVGGAIGATEDAAKKRVSRALEKIRSFLSRRGIALSAAALGTVITAKAVQAAPPTLSQAIAAAVAVNGVTATTTLVTLTMKAMFFSKLKTAAIAALFFAAAGAVTLIAFNSAGAKPEASSGPPAVAAPQPPPVPAPPVPPPPASSGGLVWDAEQKQLKAGAGEMNVSFSFNFTNTSASEIVINRVQPSCGCTTMKSLPPMPWRIASGASEHLDLTVNLAGKSGTLVKSVMVDTSAGAKSLLIRVEIPTPSATNGAFGVRTAMERTAVERAVNMQMAAADRQAIFKGDCARCHVEPTVGKAGKDLYVASCGICHDAEHRASMVPDLKALPHPTSAEFWKVMITHGKPGTLMPAFAQNAGGNLNDAQINSLVEYLVHTIPANPPATRSASVN